MTIEGLQDQKHDIIGVSYLVINPGFEKSIEQGHLPNLSIGTSLHIHNQPNPSYKRLPTFLSIQSLRNRTRNSYPNL